MAGEALHERGIAVTAPMGASNIWVDAIIIAFDPRLCEDVFCEYFFYC